MKKNTTILAIVFALFATSILLNFKFANLVDTQRATINNMQSDHQKLEECWKALKMADEIMDNNELWDTDGSDAMADYLDLRQQIDSSFLDGFHDKALLDTAAYFYNE